MSKGIIVTNIGELVSYSSPRKEMVVQNGVEMAILEGKVIEIGKDLWSPEFDRIDANGCLVTPGFVDAHTHPVFNETREIEYEMRLAGKSYMEIARAGGGIRSSVKSLRSANPADLRRKVKSRLLDFFRYGTTTIEAKSGYGLSTESEIASLRLLRELTGETGLDIRTTFLGAHEFPEEFANDHDGYIDLITGEMLPRIVREGLADFCDVFCEEGVFSVEESAKILSAAKFLGLGIRVHAEEFKPFGGARLAARYSAFSADHLMAIDDEGIHALKEACVVPVLLPATTFFLGSDAYAPGRKMWDVGLPVAIATDFNPGSCMTQSMPFVISVACLKLKLSPLEAIQAATIHAARSLKMEKTVGSLEEGKQADFVIWNIERYQGIPYFLGFPTVASVYKKGKLVWKLTDSARDIP